MRSAAVILFHFVFLILSPRVEVVAQQCNGFSGKAIFTAGTGTGHSMIQSADGGFITVGVSNSYPIGGNDWILIKTDADFQVQWSTAFGYAGTNEDGRDLVLEELPGGQIVVGGYRMQGYRKAHVMLFSGEGALQWSRQISDHYSVPRDIKAGAGDFIVAGTINVPQGASEDAYIMKMNLAGDILWSHRFDSGSGNDHFFGFSDTPAGNILVAGASAGYSGANTGILVEIQEDGTIVGQHTYHEGAVTQFLCVIRTADNHYVVGAHQNIGNTSRGIVMKLAPDFSIVWQFKIHQGQRNFVSDVYQLSTGEIAAFYQVDNNNVNTSGFGIAKIDYASGEIIEVGNPDGASAHLTQGSTKNMVMLPNDALLSVGRTAGNTSIIGFDNCFTFGCEEEQDYNIEVASFSKVIYSMPVFDCPPMINATPTSVDVTDISTDITCLSCSDILEVNVDDGCVGESLDIEVVINGDSNAATLLQSLNFTGPESGSEEGDEINIAPTEPGGYFFSATITAANGCDYTADGSFEVFEIPDLPELPQDINLCPNESFFLDLSGFPQWDEITDGAGEPVEGITFTAPGSYPVVFVSACGSVEVEVPVSGPVFDGPMLTVPPAACIDSDVEVEIPFWEEGNSDVVLNQGNGNNLIPSAATFTVSFPEAGSYNLTLTGTMDDCEIDAEASIVIEEPLELEIPSGEGICTGEVAVLDLEPFDFPVFLNGNALEVFETSSAGIYTFTAENSCGLVSADFEVEVTTFLPRPFQTAQRICEGQDTVSLGFLNPAVDVQWHSGEEELEIQVTAAGYYEAQVSNSSGECVRDFQFQIEAFEYSPAEVFPDGVLELCEEGDRTVHPAFIGVPYTFPDGSEGYSYVVEESGVVELTYSDFCYDYEYLLEVELRECLCPMWVPNAFTPDSDGLNDLFLPVVSCPVEDYRLQIMDRWGQLVFESNDPFFGWNGSYRGGDYFCSAGQYVYMIRYVQFLNRVALPQTLTGHLTLMR